MSKAAVLNLFRSKADLYQGYNIFLLLSGRDKKKKRIYSGRYRSELCVYVPLLSLMGHDQPVNNEAKS